MGRQGGQGSVLYRNINWLQSFRGKRMSARGTPLPALFLSWLALGAGRGAGERGPAADRRFDGGG